MFEGRHLPISNSASVQVPSCSPFIDLVFAVDSISLLVHLLAGFDVKSVIKLYVTDSVASSMTFQLRVPLLVL